MSALFDAWASAAKRRRWLDGMSPVVRTATRPKSMRLQWPDGTIVVAGFTSKGDRKSVVAVQHSKLPDKAASQKAKAYWRIGSTHSGRLLPPVAELPARGDGSRLAPRLDALAPASAIRGLTPVWQSFDDALVGDVRGALLVLFAAVAIVLVIASEHVAARTWPGFDPIGQRLKMGPADLEAPWMTVVGIAAPTRYRELRERSTLYVR